MDNDYSVQANFTLLTGNYTLQLTANPEEGGSPSFEGSSPFACGTDVSIFAVPNPYWSFTGWTVESGTGVIADSGAADTAVQITGDCVLAAHYTYGATATPEPTPVNYLTTTYITWHVTSDNFSLSEIQSLGLIKADMTAGVNTSMGKYVEKQMTIYLQPRPSYLLPEVNFWGEGTFSTLGTLRFSGTYATISGNVKVNGIVTVASAASNNVIDGTLTCPSTDPVTVDPAKLSWSSRITQNPNNSMPDLGDPQGFFGGTNLSTGTTDWDQADVIGEYVFTGDVDLDSTPAAVAHCWLDSTTLKPGVYYSPGTITLSDTSTRGSVTFIANRIIIRNDANTGLISGKIMLVPYAEDLLFWANASVGSPTTDFDGAILVYDTATIGGWSNHACASLEGVLFAPNGEIELAGSGRTGWFGYTDPAEIYRGALVAKNLTISGNHWNFYRW
jgi:hypothetical protein